MYIGECEEDVRLDVVKSLKSFGLKYRLKNLDKSSSMDDCTSDNRLFGVPLTYLRKDFVHLPQVKDTICIPEFIVEICNYIEEKITVEGLFRKAGSTARQKEIRALLDSGEGIDLTAHHVIDIANILKVFLRELPEPLIPYKYHDTFLRCLGLQDRKEEAVILSCLLLPQEHLNTLAFLMMFLNKVSAHSELNKMGVSNLAIILAPSVMPVLTPKLTPEGSQIINQHVQIVQILIRNSGLIGVVPEHILSGELSFSSASFQESFSNKNTAKKKKRSGSLTRMFIGLRKIVSRGSPGAEEARTPDFDKHTPCIMSGKKRKVNEPIIAPMSAKKKKEVLMNLPQGSLLPETPFKSSRNHKNENLSPRILVAGQKPGKSKSPTFKTKRRFFFRRNSEGEIRDKQSKSLSSSALKISRLSLLGKSGRKKKVTQSFQINFHVHNLFSNPRTETLIVRPWCTKYYNKTLKESEKLNSVSTEELANLLSQELKIRRSSSNKIMRSPSARKIGSIRRRSRDSASLNNVNSSDKMGVQPFYAGRSLRRGKPNTVLSGLPHPSSLVPSTHCTSFESKPGDHFGVMTRSQARRASSFHGHSINMPPANNVNVVANMPNNNSAWRCATGYFNNNEEQVESEGMHEDEANDNRRASIAKLRYQNAGMVLAKAKLFNNMNTVGDPHFTDPTQHKTTRPLSKSFRHNDLKSSRSIRRKRSDRRVYGNEMRPIDCRNNLKEDESNRLFSSEKLNCDAALGKRGSLQEKENMKMQLPLQVQRLRGSVVSPLKDCNRTPTIKRALTIGASPHRVRQAASDYKMHSRSTPVKALTMGAMPRRSPRLIQKSKTTNLNK
ncbi:rho GTPase-activating protein 24-like [Nilaparvata lugens]|uniref:rho GTPase-activating protein 24-like n=1 Tax=Nilaparvata lugens TaxID=108931 RepID=UPI00193E4170|nr:rho GTPase-activating protein 24-like [Nilaparvata lugens]